MSLISGSRLGPYEIVSPLGAGGMGEVYRAHDSRLGREVAVKVLPSGFAVDTERLRRFEQEARAAGALNHPNILGVYDIGTHDGVPYVVSELLDGETLRTRIGDSPLPQRKAVDYATQIAKGLAAAHERGIVHRDLKPDNLFVTRDGRVKILDFGLAKMGDPSAGNSETVLANAAPQTSAGTTLGTVGYMSPEQVRGLLVNHRTDLFSFGVVLYEMVTGMRPFRGSSAMDICDAILHAQPPDFGDIPVPEKLKTIIWKLLEKDPPSRYGSADEVQQKLKALEFSLVSSRPVRLSKNSWIAVGTSIVLVCVLAGWLWRGWSRQRWALQTAAPEIALLADAGEYVKAAALARDQKPRLPNRMSDK
jgi:eukaryotic-like serine/threonine-protein kinase